MLRLINLFRPAGLAIAATLALVLLPISHAGATNAADKEKEVRSIMYDFATCVIKKNHRRAADAIISNVNNTEMLKRYSDLADGKCLGAVAGNVQLSFVGDQFSYALADALVNADFAVSGPVDFANKLPLAPLSRTMKAEFEASLEKEKSKRMRVKMEENFRKNQTLTWLSSYGECVARQNPPAVRLWLLTKPSGPEELSRINVLRPAFAACMDKGTVSFGRVVMRGTVAINYYRLAMATPQPVSGSAH
ncbi:hypothetical protein [Sphingomonas sp.]|uniref:hypothetical protein n=1 Tax=Sphingomonas sp. TaxID=28214 RepID=UPI0025E8BD74|nr:hypothetical protein [Sphingomonas sp.]